MRFAAYSSLLVCALFAAAEAPSQNAPDAKQTKELPSPDGRYTLIGPTNDLNQCTFRIRDSRTGVICPFIAVDRSGGPLWSPDGKRVAFNHAAFSNLGCCYVITVDPRSVAEGATLKKQPLSGVDATVYGDHAVVEVNTELFGANMPWDSNKSSIFPLPVKGLDHVYVYAREWKSTDTIRIAIRGHRAIGEPDLVNGQRSASYSAEYDFTLGKGFKQVSFEDDAPRVLTEQERKIKKAPK